MRQPRKARGVGEGGSVALFRGVAVAHVLRREAIARANRATCGGHILQRCSGRACNNKVGVARFQHSQSMCLSLHDYFPMVDARCQMPKL